MATKRIETQLTIKAVDQYSSMLRNMRTVTGRFADGVRTEMSRLQGLRGPLRLIEDFRRQQQVVSQSGEALERARERVRQLQHAITTTRNPTAQMRREFERARATADRLEQQHQQNRRALSGLQGQLRQAGVNTGDLAGEQRRLAGALDGATTAFGRQMERMRRLETMQTRIAEARERMDRSLATAANLSFVGNASMMTGRRILTALSGPVQQAVEFESAMSDVRKVVDFDTPESFAQMSDDILRLSTRIPMAADGLAQIVAAGGQSGIAREELTRFAEMAAKIGVAFDISADLAGTSMASIKTAMGLTLDETGALFDAMNHLSNNSAARADQTLDFMNRAGASGATFGFSNTETLAIGAAMIAAGAGADTAATSFRNMGRALTRGASATKRQSEAMQTLGLDAEQVARDMQRDAVGTTAAVLQRLRELPEHMQASVMSDLFGDEARELTKLINNAELLPQLLSMVAEERQYLGSAEAEYAARAETTANNLQLMRNQMARLGVSIGEVVLPPLNDLLAGHRRCGGWGSVDCRWCPSDGSGGPDRHNGRSALRSGRPWCACHLRGWRSRIACGGHHSRGSQWFWAGADRHKPCCLHGRSRGRNPDGRGGVAWHRWSDRPANCCNRADGPCRGCGSYQCPGMGCDCGCGRGGRRGVEVLGSDFFHRQRRGVCDW